MIERDRQKEADRDQRGDHRSEKVVILEETDFQNGYLFTHTQYLSISNIYLYKCPSLHYII